MNIYPTQVWNIITIKQRIFKILGEYQLYWVPCKCDLQDIFVICYSHEKLSSCSIEDNKTKDALLQRGGACCFAHLMTGRPHNKNHAHDCIDISSYVYVGSLFVEEDPYWLSGQGSIHSGQSSNIFYWETLDKVIY